MLLEPTNQVQTLKKSPLIEKTYGKDGLVGFFLVVVFVVIAILCGLFILFVLLAHTCSVF